VAFVTGYLDVSKEGLQPTLRTPSKLHYRTKRCQVESLSQLRVDGSYTFLDRIFPVLQKASATPQFRRYKKEWFRGIGRPLRATKARMGA
jgi:hypothetical protein